MSYTIGVDVGGTNTDVAILSDSGNVIAWSKTPTTHCITACVVDAIKLALCNVAENCLNDVIKNVKVINIGTTHFINAVIERRDLAKVACIRLCGVSSLSLPPFCDFPDDLKECVCGGVYFLNGGFEFDQKVINELEENQITDAFNEIKKNGIRHVVVTGVFSPINYSQEEYVQQLLKMHYPEFSCTLSHQLGSLGLLERESAAILNEALKPLCQKTVSGLKEEIRSMHLDCLVYFTQNDGTLINECEVQKFPIYTFSSGATNSMRGAAYLANLTDAIIVDIGGTTMDVGAIVKGFPRESSNRVKIEGVSTNFRMPDIKSFGLGGGSIVILNQDQSISVGPTSVAFEIYNKALIFGGQTMVATDAAVLCKHVQIGEEKFLEHIPKELGQRIIQHIKEKVENAVDQVKISNEQCHVVLVGGGSIIVDHKKPFTGGLLIKPPFFQVANAVGAALCQVCGTFDKLIAMNKNRLELIEAAKKEAIQNAVLNGAIESTCHIVDVSEVQMSYMIVPFVRLKVKAVGNMKIHAKKTLSGYNSVDDENEFKTKHVIKQEFNPQNLCVQNDSDPVMNPPINSPEVASNGDWVVNEWDVKCLSIGAGILGCGGGGSPHLGKLRLKLCLKSGKRPIIRSPLRLSNIQNIYVVGYMGAPEIIIERLPHGSELLDSLKQCSFLLEIGFKSCLSIDEVVLITKRNSLDLISDGKTLSFKMSRPSSQNLCNIAVAPAEIGGLNALEPLIVAADLGIPVLDCDGMGRAFPQLHQFAPFIYGKSFYPAVLTNHHGDSVCCVYAESPVDLENFFREQCVQNGCAASVCFSISQEDVTKHMCHSTLSHAWHIGNAVLNARKNSFSPVDVLLSRTNGNLLSKGKINDVKRATENGFTCGRVSIEGSNGYKSILVDFQNEYLVAYISDARSVIATCPDLISLVDTDTGEPITSEEIKYGMRVSVILLPAMPLMVSELALKYVGPKAFKYNDLTYQRSCDFVKIEAIPQNNCSNDGSHFN